MEFQALPDETHQIKIFSGEILTFLKPASPLEVAGQRLQFWARPLPTPCNLPVQAKIFISGIIRGQGKAIHRPGVSCNQIAGGSFKPSHHWRCLGKRRKWLVSDDGDDDDDDDNDDDDDGNDDDNDDDDDNRYVERSLRRTLTRQGGFI